MGGEKLYTEGMKPLYRMDGENIYQIKHTKLCNRSTFYIPYRKLFENLSKLETLVSIPSEERMYAANFFLKVRTPSKYLPCTVYTCTATGRKKERKIIPEKVDTTFRCNAQGSAPTSLGPMKDRHPKHMVQHIQPLSILLLLLLYFTHK